LPVAYLRLVPVPDVLIRIESLPSLIGTESPFTFQTMNIEHGLLATARPWHDT
jgi:hypothetical protein